MTRCRLCVSDDSRSGYAPKLVQSFYLSHLYKNLPTWTLLYFGMEFFLHSVVELRSSSSRISFCDVSAHDFLDPYSLPLRSTELLLLHHCIGKSLSQWRLYSSPALQREDHAPDRHQRATHDVICRSLDTAQSIARLYFGAGLSDSRLLRVERNFRLLVNHV